MVLLEEFENFGAMRVNYKYMHDLVPQPPEFKKSVATCMQDKNNYWIYHRHFVENSEEEKIAKIEKRDTRVKIQQSFETPNKNIIKKEEIRKQKKLMKNKYFQNLNREINDKPQEIVI